MESIAVGRTGGVRTAALVTTWMFALMLGTSGVLFMVGPPRVVEAVRGLGYPDYFGPLLGIAKVAGAIVLVTARPSALREWAYAGFTFTLLAAIASHAVTGGRFEVVPPFLALGLLLASRWLRRQAEAAR